MNLAVSPQTIPIAWQDYLSENYEIVQVWSRTEDGKNYNFSEYRSGDRVILNSFPTLELTVDEMVLKK